MIALGELLPLRQSTVWPGFREARTVPIRYGATAGACLQVDDSARLWCWADHPVVSIDAVTVAGTAVGNWQWRNAADSTGRTVALVEFDEAPDVGAAVVATGRGKPHPATGALMQSPADLVWDLLANVAGQAIEAAALADFRAQTATLTAGGSFVAPIKLRDAVRAVCGSVGALFAAPARCLLWPGGSLAASVATVARRHVLTAEARHEAVATDLRVAFAFEDATPTASLQISAPAAVARFGRRVADVALPFVVEPRVALAVATRLLQQRARPVWQITAQGIERVLRVGDTVTLDHPGSPVSGDALVLARETDVGTRWTQVRVAVPVGAPPAVVLLGQATRSDPAQYASVAVQTVDTERVLTLKEADGSPLVGAQVTVDGDIVRSSDSQGRVSFPAYLLPRGEHELAIVAADGRRLTLTVLV